MNVDKFDDDLWNLVRGVWLSVEWIRTCRPLSANFSRRLASMRAGLGEYSPELSLVGIQLARYYYSAVTICIMTGVGH